MRRLRGIRGMGRPFRVGLWELALIAPALRNRADALMFRRQFFALEQFMVRLGDQILRADVFDRGNFVVELAELLFFFQHVFKTGRQSVDGKRHGLEVARSARRIVFNDALFRIGTEKTQALFEIRDVFVIFRHVAREPIGADHRLEKALDQGRSFLQNPPRRGDDSFRSPVRILIRRTDEYVAAFFFKIFGVPSGDRCALDAAASDSILEQMVRYADAHPLDVACQIQAGLFELNLNRPMTNAVEVADADTLAFEIGQRLDVRWPDPDVGVLVAPSGDDVEIGAARTQLDPCSLNSQDLLNLLEHLRWLNHDPLCRLLKLLTGYRVYRPARFLGLGDEFRIPHGSCIGFTQNFYPVPRCSGRGHRRVAELLTASQNFHRATTYILGFVLVHEFGNGRRVRRARIRFPAGLKQVPVESLRMPRQERLAATVRR